MSAPFEQSSAYDLLVIGSGPAGQKAALAAAKQRCRVAIIDQRQTLGGACLHTGTIPSKTLREAVLYFTGYGLHSIYGAAYRPKQHITREDLTFRVQHVIRHELEVILDQMQRNGVDMYYGTARFLSPTTVEITSGHTVTGLKAHKIVIAVGSEPAQPTHIPFTPGRIVDSDGMLDLPAIPRSLVVVGAGVIGCEYASIFATLGTEVTLVDSRDRLLEFVDREIVDTLMYHMRRQNVTLRLGEAVARVFIDDRDRVVTELESGKRMVAETLLFSIGRQGATAALHLEAAGLRADERGRMVVNTTYQTAVEHIYAAGDVIGFPSLAATSMEQGRLAACHALGLACDSFSQLSPLGIYTIPEISMVGETEEQLTKAHVPYELGIARYAEIARGQLIGDEHGMLKLLFHRDSLKLLGVHAIGERAAELIHIGQAVMAYGGTVEYFVDTVFNYPTLAEAYKIAAFDGLNKL
ncbi:MAG: Si-specific NAD(P)(+) transhydrogenase [Candidatus Tectomicrobia bacterium]|uniref:Soluble pyridine nucleotide transhydrogenase n=1 Tax=Tectimicrobiota bacterium TaxID=2528274 RepID=A0A937VWS3_UNCTE|nr:Si-specific NAD(P)(+) transhydrogenase [Candidatus Tectomicrobia bacterium]